MKIALCQLNYTIADIEGNKKKIIDAINNAKTSNADLAVFSELSICGYPPDDLLDYPFFIDKCKQAVLEIAEHCDNIAIIIGSPSLNTSKIGKSIFNSAFFIENKAIKNIVNKTLLPTYDIFNEARYFEPNNLFELISFKGKKIALTICEDLWSNTDFLKYETDPLAELVKHHPDFIINIAASPFNKGKLEQRFDILKKQAETQQLNLIYVNQVGAHTDIIFDGNSMVINPKGEVLLQLPAFEEAIYTFDIENTAIEPIAPNKKNIALLHQALVFGLKNYFEKMGFKKAILGSSGGIDSALVQALASEAIGADNVTAVLMPSEFSSEGSVADAQKLSETLGNPFEILPIKEIYNTYINTLEPVFGNLPFNTTEENIQARCRAILLMAMSNKFGYILLNTSNKSEMAVGYSTLYGDMCGSLSVIGDLYKTEVYALCKYINRNSEIIPNTIINKAPSAELRPDQKDSDSLPDYEILDSILYQYIEEQKSAEQIIASGHKEETVLKTIRMVNNNEFKRFQAPPILRVSAKAFGRGRQIPLVSKW